MNRRKWVVEIVSQIVKKGHAQPVQTAEIIVDRLEEEGLLHLGFGDAEVDAIVESFKSNFGSTKISIHDRWAAQRLTNKYGSQAIVGIIVLLASLQSEKFAPVANSVSQLEEKMPSILNFLRKQKGEEVINV